MDYVWIIGAVIVIVKYHYLYSSCSIMNDKGTCLAHEVMIQMSTNVLSQDFWDHFGRIMELHYFTSIIIKHNASFSIYLTVSREYFLIVQNSHSSDLRRYPLRQCPRIIQKLLFGDSHNIFRIM